MAIRVNKERVYKTSAALMLLSWSLFFPSGLSAESGALRVAAVQFEVSEERFFSEGAFRSSVSTLVSEAVAAGSELIIFPEYIGVFLATAPYAAQIRPSETVRDALQRIRAAAPDSAPNIEPTATAAGPLNLRRLFLDGAPEVSLLMDEVFGGLAAEHQVHILAGSYFHRSTGSGGSSRLTNRAVLYGPRGERAYEQDKVFLTPFESQLIELDAGTLSAVDGFSIDGISVGLTICRDTFFDAWDPIHEDREVWIDIKADGVAYDEAARRRYYETIPERLEETDVPYGITASLVGSFLELFWEGSTRFVFWDEERLRTLDRSRSSRRQEIVVETIEEP